jgi:hypothetical protein
VCPPYPLWFTCVGHTPKRRGANALKRPACHELPAPTRHSGSGQRPPPTLPDRGQRVSADPPCPRGCRSHSGTWPGRGQTHRACRASPDDGDHDTGVDVAWCVSPARPSIVIGRCMTTASRARCARQLRAEQRHRGTSARPACWKMPLSAGQDVRQPNMAHTTTEPYEEV